MPQEVCPSPGRMRWGPARLVGGGLRWGVTSGSALTAACSVADGGDRVLPGAERLRAGWLGSPRPRLEGPAASTPQKGTAAETLQSPGNPQQCPTLAPSPAPGDSGWEAELVPVCGGVGNLRSCQQCPGSLASFPPVPHPWLGSWPLFSFQR